MLKTIILRHRKENKKKCTLEPLKNRDDWAFFTYPKDTLIAPKNCVVLSFEGPLLTKKDENSSLLLIDGTWRYATKMYDQTPLIHTLEKRSLPSTLKTAYPRKQDDCEKPSEGLASIEALFAAYSILGWDSTYLLDHYPFKDKFLELNSLFF